MSNETLPIARDGCWSCFKPTETGMEIRGKPTYDEWEEAFRGLRRLVGAVQWLIGDMMLYGEHAFPQEYTQALEAADYEQHSCQNMQYVASRIGKSRRRESLSFSHHAEVAGMEVADQERLLDEAEEKAMSRADLRKRASEVRQLKATGKDADDEPLLKDADVMTVMLDLVVKGCDATIQAWRAGEYTSGVEDDEAKERIEQHVKHFEHVKRRSKELIAELRRIKG